MYREGVALLSSSAFTIRCVCFTCGSQGLEKVTSSSIHCTAFILKKGEVLNVVFVLCVLQLIHCSICCEPFHIFCLEAIYRPLKSQLDDWSWCCPRCQFCHVCAKQDNVRITCIIILVNARFYMKAAMYSCILLIRIKVETAQLYQTPWYNQEVLFKSTVN